MKSMSMLVVVIVVLIASCITAYRLDRYNSNGGQEFIASPNDDHQSRHVSTKSIDYITDFNNFFPYTLLCEYFSIPFVCV
jgi:hypothetical protein